MFALGNGIIYALHTKDNIIPFDLGKKKDRLEASIPFFSLECTLFGLLLSRVPLKRWK